jgi:hypothetical protein
VRAPHPLVLTPDPERARLGPVAVRLPSAVLLPVLLLQLHLPPPALVLQKAAHGMKAAHLTADGDGGGGVPAPQVLLDC